MFSNTRGRLRACPFLFSTVVAMALASAQEVRLYSEFQRIDPFGRVVRADLVAKPREIISPAALRNGFTSFHVVISVPAGASYDLHIGQNPEDAVKAALYRERHRRFGEEWIPEALTPVPLPFSGSLAADIPGRKVDVFWLDLWVRAGAPVERVRVEVQLNVGERWIIYPLEVRISDPVVPSNVFRKLQAPVSASPSGTQPADAPANTALRGYLCEPAPAARTLPAPTIPRFILRNALQDIAVARQAEVSQGAETVRAALLAALNAPDTQAWCTGSSQYRPAGAETWLKVRNAVWRLN